ncbi:TetR/AcrR family transcriptional regulator [Desulfatibacillum aliphaticivorans]|uniref:Transcriptional regulator, TetR family n=1 Tax=Desulfatibacillum aliphaticivorans TaxID=218208 RepID=B8FFA0_DESAL|nr:TetR/AcrR family transcriptional regulator [Desulfatibacillum aliphaticivorans]ACL04160.1 transcriptional regulator, TetR family [Desulfatibacillum aliphaticivorans]
MMTYEEFKSMVHLSRREICKEIFNENKDLIKVKKPERVVKNLGKIFEATLALSNKKGFHAMSLRDLSSGAGLSMGALYSYFSSKEELLRMIQDQGRRITSRILEEQIGTVEATREKLQTAIVVHLYLSEVMQPWFYFSYMEAKNLPKRAQKEAILSELSTEQMYADIIKQGQREGIFKPRDPEMTSAFIKAMLQDWYLKKWKYQARQVTVDAYGKVVVDWAFAYLDNQTAMEQ